MEEDDLAYNPPPSETAVLLLMELLDAVRLLSCKYAPPPTSPATLLFADVPWLSVMEEDDSAYVPPPLLPAVLLSMELFDAMRLLSFRYIPPPCVAAALPFADVPWLSVMDDDSEYAPPPLPPELLLIELLEIVTLLLYE